MGILRILFLALVVPSLASFGGGRDLRGRGDASANSNRATWDGAAAEATYGTISVTGTDTAASTPNMATINLGVSIVKETAQEALAENSQTVAEIVTALEAFGIGEADLQTRYFSVNIEYDYSLSPEPTIRGYRVNNNIVVTVNNLDEVGDILDAAIQNGANDVSGINFSNSNVDAAYEIARKAAVENAYARAVLYAM